MICQHLYIPLFRPTTTLIKVKDLKGYIPFHPLVPLSELGQSLICISKLGMRSTNPISVDYSQWRGEHEIKKEIKEIQKRFQIFSQKEKNCS